MNYEILEATRRRVLTMNIPEEHDNDTHGYYSIDYLNGLYGFAVTELGRYMDAMWSLR